MEDNWSAAEEQGPESLPHGGQKLLMAIKQQKDYRMKKYVVVPYSAYTNVKVIKKNHHITQMKTIQDEVWRIY